MQREQVQMQQELAPMQQELAPMQQELAPIAASSCSVQWRYRCRRLRLRRRNPQRLRSGSRPQCSYS